MKKLFYYYIFKVYWFQKLLIKFGRKVAKHINYSFVSRPFVKYCVRTIFFVGNIDFF